ncbi:alpha/beta hydrolase [Pendulispora rubella]|uniref:Alpha/beta hydrolase n=1 Tax=Pendulispora rubella TaxID=2741070 RepID=A0ABZ2L1Q8_9BACT
MRAVSISLFACVLAGCASSPAPAPAAPTAPAPATTSSVATSEPVDDGIDYGFPVQRLPIDIEGQHVSMAYMDVAPAPSAGAANGRTIVLLHGKNFSGFYFRRVIEVLRADGYRVVVPDQVGFGKSSRPDVAYSFHWLAHNTKQLLDTLGIQRAVILGHSMGGMLATRFALLYPEKVTELVLEDPIGLEDYRSFVPYTTMDQKLKVELAANPDNVRKYFQNSYFKEWKPEYEPLVDTAARYTKLSNFPQAAKVSALTSEMIYLQPICYEFDRLRVPTLLIVGTADRTIVGKNLLKPDVVAEHGRYDRLGKETAAKIPGSKLVELPGIGHIPHVEVEERFLTEVRSFLAAKR